MFLNIAFLADGLRFNLFFFFFFFVPHPCATGRLSLQAIGNPVTATFPNQKQRMTFLCGASRDITACLDIAKVADVLIFAVNVADNVEECVDKVAQTRS